MAFTDNREPAVYIHVEDRSYVNAVTESGRTVVGVFVSPKGRHRRVVDITGGTTQLHNEFGTPNITNCNIAYYEFDNALRAGARGLAIRVTPDDSTLSNVIIKKNTAPINTVGTDLDFTFRENESEISVDATNWDVIIGEGPTRLTIGDWIYANDGVDSSVDIRQIISIDDDEKKLILNDPYLGATTEWVTKQSSISKYTLYVETEENALWDTNYTQSEDLADPGNTVYEFYAIGAGAYYNKLKIKATRDTDHEKLYMYAPDENDLDRVEIEYPYLFWKLTLYEVKENGQDKALEGPWRVSLVNTLPNGQPILDLQGNVLYIEDVINSNSEIIRCQAGDAIGELLTSELPKEVCERNRLLVSLLMASSAPAGTSNYVTSDNALLFTNGSDGTSDGVALYNKITGKVNIGQDLLGLIAQAYNGTLEQYDDSVSKLRETIYGRYSPDYVLAGDYPAWVKNAAREFADFRDDVLLIASTDQVNNFAKDIKAREDLYAWNTYNAMLYTQWRKRKDEYTGKSFWFPPSYHAIDRHLYCDGVYWIHEPVANMEKGAISEPIELAYEPNHTERGDLQDKELNFTIKEPDGVYFLTQLTTWKRLSSLKRANNIKFIHYMKKELPPLLKDVLQRKATNVWLGQLKSRVENFMSKFRGSATERYNILDYYTTAVQYDKTAYEANVYITISFIGVIERINVFIINE